MRLPVIARSAAIRPAIPIKITALRPGEKLFEEVFHGSEPLLPTACSGILLAAPRAGDAPSLASAIDQLGAACERGDARDARRVGRRRIYIVKPQDAGRASQLRANICRRYDSMPPLR